MPKTTLRNERIRQVTKSVKNYIINGGFDFWQRASTGTSLPFNFESYTGPDRFSIPVTGANRAGDGFSKVSDSPIPKFYNSLELVRGSGDAAEKLNVGQKVESIFSEELINKNLVYSFYFKKETSNINQIDVYFWDSTVKDDLTSVTLRKSLSIDVSSQTLGTWERYTVKVSESEIPNIQNGLLVSTSIGKNDAASMTCRVFGFMLHEETTEEVEFRRFGEDYTEELELCRRYFEKSYDLETNPGTASNFNGQRFDIANDAGNQRSFDNFNSVKRGLPQVTLYSPDSGAAGVVKTDVGDLAQSATGIGMKGYTVLAGTVARSNVSWHYTADAEL